MSPSDFLVTALELDGNDLGPLINYTKENLYDEAEKQFNRRVLSKSNRSRSGHRHRCREMYELINDFQIINISL